tara:strand:- start:611 stop:745 length:135 start_codon:yes stop_codon:yes gene_type:complete
MVLQSAFKILQKDPHHYTAQALIDEDILRAAGETNFVFVTYFTQ